VTTFADLQTEVLDHQFSEARYSSFALKQLHRAEDIICAQTDFRELQRSFTITTISGYPTWLLPVDFKRLYTVSRADSSFNETPLLRREQTQFDALPVQAGQPTDYLIYSNTLKLWPTPDDAYLIRLDYFAKPDQAADSPSIPEEYRHLLVDWALARCYARENDYNSAQYHQGVFDAGVMKMRGEVQYDTSDYGQPRVLGDNGTLLERDETPRRI
jgi:hypothetical protein